MKWQPLWLREFAKMNSRAKQIAGFHLPFCLMVLVAVQVMFATNSVAGTLPVPTVTIYPGDKISSGMLRIGRFSDQTVAVGGYIRRAETLYGMVARRTLIRGRAIPTNSIRRPYLVRNGQPVILRYHSGALSILAKAVSLKSGIVGDYVQARNVDTGRTVAGLVQRDGSILVSLK